MKPVLLHPEARLEFAEAIIYYEEHIAGLGAEFEAAVETALAHIQHSPDRWSFLTGLTRRYVMKRFPYSVIYAGSPLDSRGCSRKTTSGLLARALR